MPHKNPFEHPHFVWAKKIEDVDDGLQLLTFPDGFRCYTHTSEEETTLIYNEIFIQQEYLGSKISLRNCRYVFDVGANIGLFTLFAKLRNRNLIVHAFEPIKATYDVLVKNVELHNLSDVHMHNHALGALDDSSHLMTFYPNAAGNSTAHPVGKEALKQTLQGLLGREQANYLFDAPQSTVGTNTHTLCYYRREYDSHN